MYALLENISIDRIQGILERFGGDLVKLAGTAIYIRFLEESDAEAMHGLETRNQEFFQNFTALRHPDFYTLEGQVNRIKKSAELRAQDQQYMFGIFLTGIDELIGWVSLTEVLRGALESCYVGYMMDRTHNGKGYMTEAVRLVVSYAFDEINLHRIEAGVMPHNVGSIRVLEKAGFHKEGIAKKNVKINGRWQDHQILAIVNEEDEE